MSCIFQIPLQSYNFFSKFANFDGKKSHNRIFCGIFFVFTAFYENLFSQKYLPIVKPFYAKSYFYELLCFSIHSVGDDPVSRANVREKTDADENPDCSATSCTFISGFSSISRLASPMR